MDKQAQEPDLWGIKLNDADVNAQINSWMEYAFTYARVITGKEKHFLKAGVTFNIIQGLGSGYMFMKDMNYEVNNQDTVSFYNTYTNYGASGNIDENFDYHFNTDVSTSFNFGIVYEYRPQWMKYKYDMNGRTNLWRKDQDKYLLRIGFTASDIGSTHYARNPLSTDFNADIYKLAVKELDISSVADFNNFIDSTFTTYPVSDNYTMNLPLSFSLQADVRLAQGLYFNVIPYLALSRGNDNVNKVHYISSISMVPRYDRKWFGVSVPVQYNDYKLWSVGLGLRLGPVWVGWNDLFTSLFTSKFVYQSTASVVLKIPVFQGRPPKDSDNDKVSDDVDQCPFAPGIFVLNGCPDQDNDGIIDSKDKCPMVIGLFEYDGCPDTDLDGIIDENDLCPTTKGLPWLGGCPDSDGDSIIDQDDSCPNNAGSRKMFGCPDMDGDGIPDKDDNCPTVSGTVENRGCPFIDTDGDGLDDESDNCPGIFGPIENHGCPFTDTDKDSIPDKDDDCPTIPGLKMFKGCPDTDGDGISDKYDNCPTIPGIIENNGCPEIKKEEQAILKKAFETLEFETGKSIIKKASLGALDELANVMKSRSEFKLLLAGHTDNVGKPESNLLLSKNRAAAVKNYIVKRGVDPDRIKTEWYGQEKPIATNETPAGRQQNRRVEMAIVFE
jgi:outer membrane protein OmpA-like peptidoglycan-associated protein